MPKRIKRLREPGLAELALRIDAPAGLDLGSRVAAEIAISVAAQVIQVRYRLKAKRTDHITYGNPRVII